MRSQYHHKYGLAVALFLFFILPAIAQESQDTSYWKKSGQATLNFSQVALSNWIGGGNSSAAGIARLNYNAIYQKDRIQWDNTLKTGYGLMKEEGNQVVKNEDLLELNSKFGVQMNIENLLYASFLNFTTQFAPGYNYPNTTDKISDFFAPAYLTIASGFDYQPSETFSLFVTPASAKFTIVTDDSLSNAGAFGVEPGEKLRAELGATLRAEYKAGIMTNVDLSSSLMLFSNYLDNPQNIDVNLELALNMKINDYLSANFSANMIYDHDILIPLDNEGRMGRRVQLKQILGVGFSYSF